MSAPSPTLSDRSDADPAAELGTDHLHLSRGPDRYRLTGRVGTARVTSPEPLSAAAVRDYLRTFRRARITADLPAGDPMRVPA